MMLEAGRELDALVAEKVMGWTRHVSDDRGDAYSESWGFGPNLLTDSLFVHEFEPSVDIAAAWQVIEKADEFEMWNHTGKSYGCRLTFGNREAFAKADTAPLAICLAALKAAEQR